MTRLALIRHTEPDAIRGVWYVVRAVRVEPQPHEHVALVAYGDGRVRRSTRQAADDAAMKAVGEMGACEAEWRDER